MDEMKSIQDELLAIAELTDLRISCDTCKHIGWKPNKGRYVTMYSLKCDLDVFSNSSAFEGVPCDYPRKSWVCPLWEPV